ncbi:riboflavin synthase [Chthonobacter rhizosphaerae]|uniref:riboflavin synthase n=1 Tax=Chthonobacter rhizosphaerae TaxID=2735553 RepID=UPI0015EF8318|nr:riboflavin synthase [Chthonobacter rhizosphaerae]
MFTGIITDVGEVVAVRPRETGVSLDIATVYEPDGIALGASIACSGACLTVVDKGRTDGRNWFQVEASIETLDKTTLGAWTPGTRINLERALKIGDELGGHIVTGHVDGMAELIARENVADMAKLTFRVPRPLARFIAQKGSVTLDGTSLTVNDVDGDVFSVFLIPHTLTVTTWGTSAVGDRINLEVDMMARYVARLQEAG